MVKKKEIESKIKEMKKLKIEKFLTIYMKLNAESKLVSAESKLVLNEFEKIELND
jgi:hypothetical protein